MCPRWKNYFQVSLLILFSPQWVKQSLPPWYWDRVLLYHFSNVWIETYLSECQYILRLCAFPLSILNLLVNQCIGEFCLCNGSQQWELRDYKNLERSVQANIMRNKTIAKIWVLQFIVILKLLIIRVWASYFPLKLG